MKWHLVDSCEPSTPESFPEARPGFRGRAVSLKGPENEKRQPEKGSPREVNSSSLQNPHLRNSNNDPRKTLIQKSLCDFAKARNKKAQAKLWIKVIEAHLQLFDVEELASTSAAAPYVIVSVEGEKRSTTTNIAKTDARPYWNDEFVVPIKFSSPITIRFEVVDRQRYKNRDYFGRATASFDLDDLQQQQQQLQDLWLDLSPGRWKYGSKDETVGQIHVQLRYSKPGAALLNEEDEQSNPLQRLINDPVALEYFTKFLKQDYSIENYLFWRDVEHFKASYDSHELNKAYDEAVEIFDRYFRVKSQFEVNLDHFTKTSLCDVFHKYGFGAGGDDNEYGNDYDYSSCSCSCSSRVDAIGGGGGGDGTETSTIDSTASTSTTTDTESGSNKFKFIEELRDSRALGSAQSMVYYTLQVDVYPRFKKSPFYQELLESAVWASYYQALPSLDKRRKALLMLARVLDTSDLQFLQDACATVQRQEVLSVDELAQKFFDSNTNNSYSNSNRDTTTGSVSTTTTTISISNNNNDTISADYTYDSVPSSTEVTPREGRYNNSNDSNSDDLSSTEFTADTMTFISVETVAENVESVAATTNTTSGTSPSSGGGYQSPIPLSSSSLLKTSPLHMSDTILGGSMGSLLSLTSIDISAFNNNNKSSSKKERRNTTGNRNRKSFTLPTKTSALPTLTLPTTTTTTTEDQAQQGSKKSVTELKTMFERIASSPRQSPAPPHARK